MANTEKLRPELVARSADYFASNPDVDKLLVIVGTGIFYRPERETLAAYEAAVAETSVMTIHRYEAEGTTAAPSNEVDVEDLVKGAVPLPGVEDAATSADEAATTEPAAAEAATDEAATAENAAPEAAMDEAATTEPAAPEAVKAAKPAKDVTKKTATTPKASK